MKIRFILLLNIFGLISLPVFGQGFSLHQYFSPQQYGGHVQNWTAEKDTQGYIHFGNGGGLLTFDGNKWYNNHIGERGRGSSIFTATNGTTFVSGSGNFGFIASDSLSSLSYKSLSDVFYSPGERVPEQFDTHEKTGNLYFRYSEGLNKYDGKELVRFESDSGSLSHSVMLGDSLLIGSQFGMVSFDLKREDGFKRVKGSEIFSGDQVWIAKNYKPGHILFGGWKNLFQNYDGSDFVPFETEVDDYLKQHLIYDFEVINDSLYAIATLSGGVVFIDNNGKLLKMFTEKNGLATNQVYDLYKDDENILWMGLQKGIQKLLMEDDLTVYNESAGLNDVVTNFALNNQRLLVNTAFGIFKGEKIQPEQTIHFAEIDAPERFSDVFTRNGQFYALSSTGLYEVQDDWSFKKVIDEPYLVKVNVKEESKQITLVNREKLIQFDGIQLKEKTLPEINYPTQALSKGDSLFVLNSSLGLQLILKDSVYNIPFSGNEEAINVYNEIDFINNEVFVGAEGDDAPDLLFRFKPQNGLMSPNHFLSGFPEFSNDQVFTFEQCSDSEIWFIANLKLIRAFKESGSWNINTSSYRLIKGENAVESIFSIACVPSGVWFGGTNGLFHLKESEFSYDSEFRTNITGIYINRDSLIYGGYGEPREPIILPFKHNELRFSYAAASYIAPELNQYQVMLEGFDSGWSSWTSETQKDYTNITEGTYTFLVRSKNAYDVAGSSDAVTFQILPPWYRTWWAYLLYTIFISGMLYLIYRVRVNQLLRVQRIRNNIASDLHDEVSATLSSISYFAKAIESEKITGDKNRFVRLIANSAGDAKEKITDIVWAINPEHDDWKEFLSKCRRFTSDLLESKNIDYSLKITDFIPGKLDMQLRQHLWLIFKEMITNAARHSEAKNVDVIIKYEDGIFRLVVQDDGTGMDIDHVKKGNGLVNINKRADLINGEISLKTSAGFGTRWILKVNL
ncbi:sensor histidine kinase [Gracilimonas tropica]|uniref:sensor histidine kinase n=1 Tax=Gracilimonas tropica TaxID=454600 RepID=UPI00035C5338|nr:ATP-binding protein [Gracilimonas tropica]